MFLWGFVCVVLTAVSLMITVVSFLKRGFVFHNAYIWASRAERETMDKRPFYRQSGIAFGLVTIALGFMALGCIMGTLWPLIITAAACVAVLVYAIMISVKKTEK